jgi:uncharacterized protein YxeA
MEVAMAYAGGKEKRVNTATSGSQVSPEVTALTDGGWVVSWTSYGQDGSSGGIYQQRYTANGSKSGVETLVPTSTTNSQFQPHIASLTDGGWVVAWSSNSSNPDIGSEIRLQAYNPNGSKQGVEMQANSSVLGEQSTAQVAGLSTGGWIVTWQGQDEDLGDGDSKFDIYQQAYNASGQKVGGETLVNTFTTSDQFDSSVTALANGRWAVTWASYGHAGDTSGIYAQIYQANGSKLGGEIHVNTYTPGNQYNPDITTLKNGDFVVTWESQDQDGSGYGIYQQRYDADGTTDGGEKRVNKTLAQDQDTVDVTALSTGGYVVTWQSEKGGDKSGYGIYGQAYNANGNKVGTEFLVNKHTNSEQAECSVAGLDKGRFVVTWESYDVDGSNSAIVQRVFSDAGKKLSAEKLTLDFRPEISGNSKDNTLVGTDIGEKFYGKGGDDTISGKGGNDLLDGGKGNDLLIGGDGKDVFVFKTGYGGDTVRGFFGGDRIDLRDLDGIVDFNDLKTNHMSQVGADARIEGPNGDVLWIRHALVGTLEAGDFLFAA